MSWLLVVIAVMKDQNYPSFVAHDVPSYELCEALAHDMPSHMKDAVKYPPFVACIPKGPMV